MMFITPMPPTRREMAATLASRIVSVWVTACAVLSTWVELVIV